MKRILAFLLILTSFSAINALAESRDVQKHLLKLVKEQVDKECPRCRVEMEILNLESIDDIARPDRVLADHWRGQTNLVLKVAGESRIVTANIRWWDQVVIAKANIRQGALLKKDDLRIVEKDVTFLKTAYVQDIEQATGLVSKRVFGRGQIIDDGMLKKPLVVRYGQPIKVEIMSPSFVVQMSGRAKGAGAIGDRIPIFIPRTQKKMSAKIISQGLVRAL